IETGRSAIALEHRRPVPIDSCPTIVIRIVDSMRPRIGAFKRQAVRELFVERNLQRIVLRAEISVPHIRGGRSANVGLRQQRRARTRESGIDVIIRQLVNCVLSYVTCRQYDLTRKLALQCKIPRLYIAAMNEAVGASFAGGW